jgi:hypothetical protein
VAIGVKRDLLVSKSWVQAAVIVFLFGFLILGLLAYRTYTGEPPIPNKVVDTSGNLLFTRADILEGQGIFLRNGLMEYGSIFGHGAYLGPDFTADYLHRAAMVVQNTYLIRIHAKLPSRQLRYRAPAHACNSCSMKQGCTDSDQGREIEHHLDLWFQTGLNHFHHGISLTLLLLSAILLAVEAIRFREPGTLLMIGGLFAPVAFLSIRRFTEFRAGRGDQEMHSNPSR